MSDNKLPFNEALKGVKEKLSGASDKKVLIVEDDEDSRKYLVAVFKKYFGNIITADNGENAVFLANANKDISLVIMDIRLPVMNGSDAAVLIRKILPGVPIIAQTAYAFPDEKKKYKAAFDDYITKPFRQQELLTLVAQHI